MDHDDLLPDIDAQETTEWLDALQTIISIHGTNRAEFILRKLITRAKNLNVPIPGLIQTHYINTIEPQDQPLYPGDEETEQRIRRIIRWNAVAMVVRANLDGEGVGGHMSTYASSASLYEVGFNHFFRGPDLKGAGDQIYFQGHAAPGIYSRAFLEGRLTQEHLRNFRREAAFGRGLSSYPHPRLMPDFWQFPTVSMGLGPISAIYQARFNKYLQARNILNTENSKVWCFVGDGETDEVETIGAIDLAAREKLDNLIFVINCNLQRLDGPVRGNGKIIQELEGHFRGMGWHVLKVIWGRGWDLLLEKDTNGLLVQAFDQMVDGQSQRYSISSPEYVRKHFFGQDPRLLKMVESWSDRRLGKLRRGGHDYSKVYAAYKDAVETKDKPTVILAHTVKGWTLGTGLMGKNVTHSKKAMSVAELKAFRDELHLPILDKDLEEEPPFYHPGEDSKEIKYLKEKRVALGGFVPQRKVILEKVELPGEDLFSEFMPGSGKNAVSTTMVFVRLLTKLMRDKKIGQRVVPIIPDEARTFGMQSMFPEFGIFSPVGQLYDPVDKEKMLFYKETKDGQILEEGITEAGSMASFQATATAYATHGVKMIPFYIFYSMFGMQRTGDQVWQLGDIRGRGFLMGATAGRTTLNGEGLQHQDGHSHVLAGVVPNCISYDPAFAYELAIIIENGLHRMYELDEDIFFYITIQNENYLMPATPEHLDTSSLKQGIIDGIYQFKVATDAQVQLLGSASIFNEVAKAADILEKDFGIAANVWNVTSYNNLRKDALKIQRTNFLNPGAEKKLNVLQKVLGPTNGPIIAASDYIRLLPDSIGPWLNGRLFSLGTDGFGFSDTRGNLRKHFEVDAPNIVVKVLYHMHAQGSVQLSVLEEALKKYNISDHNPDPLSL